MDPHPVLAAAGALAELLEGVADVPVEFLGTDDTREALLTVGRIAAEVEGLRLRLIAAAGDVAADDGCRDVASWLVARTRAERGTSRRSERLAHSLATRWQRVSAALATGTINAEQVEAIVRSLDELPGDLPAETRTLAEVHLVGQAQHFGPRELRALGRRILDVVAPEVGEERARRLLEAEERRALQRTRLVSQRRGDGTTLFRIAVPDAAADRLLTYLHAFTSPRREPTIDEHVDRSERVPYDVKLGHAFCAMLERLDPSRLPVHGGDATTVVVTVDLKTLIDGFGTAALGSDTEISAAQARRLACTAKILPMVLGGKSEVLDLGRSARLFSRSQRTALAVRDRTCRAQGCDIPAAWCEAHHAAAPWSRGGRTDLRDGRLLCSWHHHRAHDERYQHTELPNGDVRFHRRR